MKRHISRLIAIFLLVYSTICLYGADENLIKAGGFEEGLLVENWERKIWKNGGSIVVSNEKAHTGTKALKILTGKQNNDVRVAQNIKIKPDTFYKYSGWIATKDVNNNGIGGNIGFLGGQQHASDLKGTNDWKYVEISFKTSSMQKTVSIAAGIGTFGQLAQGTVYIDDLILVELNKEPKNFFSFISPSADKKKAVKTIPRQKKLVLSKKLINIIGLCVLAILIIIINLAVISYRHRGFVKKIFIRIGNELIRFKRHKSTDKEKID